MGYFWGAADVSSTLRRAVSCPQIHRAMMAMAKATAMKVNGQDD